ncbi:hypothetical protein T439DRAFT_322456 [Meredithblackwellia eburnea MCA 4105]
MHSLTLVTAILAAAPHAFAQLSTFRGTIPGALHQCENTSMNFFDSGNERPLSVLFVPEAALPTSLKTGTTTIDVIEQYSPLQVIQGIQTPDAGAYPFILQIAAGQVFEVFGFLPDGTGKALSLTRTVMTPLPGATNCVVNVQTVVTGAGAVTTAAASTSAAVTSSKASSTKKTSSVAASSTPTTSATSSSASSAAASASASAHSGAESNLAFPGIAALFAVVGGALAIFA